MYNRIKELAQLNGMTLQEVEQKAKLGPGLISKWKRNPRPNLSKLQAVADVLGVTIIELLKEE